MKTILVADDEDLLRLLVCEALSEGGYRVVEARDGAAALRLAREAAPDLVILDWMMPGASGIEVLRQLRADAATAAVPVVMLSAKARPGDAEQAAALGVDCYLQKPFSPFELARRVAAILSGNPGPPVPEPR